MNNETICFMTGGIVGCLSTILGMIMYRLLFPEQKESVFVTGVTTSNAKEFLTKLLG